MDWKTITEAEARKPYFQNLMAAVEKEYMGQAGRAAPERRADRPLQAARVPPEHGLGKIHGRHPGSRERKAGASRLHAVGPVRPRQGPFPEQPGAPGPGIRPPVALLRRQGLLRERPFQEMQPVPGGQGRGAHQLDDNMSQDKNKGGTVWIWIIF